MDDETADDTRLFDLLFALLRDGSLNAQHLNEVLCKGNDCTKIFSQLTEQDSGGACGKVFTRGDYAYQCRTCQSDDTCIICVDCFNHSNHQGHDVRMTFAHGGCCDCGDLESWDLCGTCTKHRPLDTIPDLPDSLDPAVIRFVIYVLSSAFSCVNNIHFVHDRIDPNGDTLVKWKSKQTKYEDVDVIMQTFSPFVDDEVSSHIRAMTADNAPVTVIRKMAWERNLPTEGISDLLLGEEITESHLMINPKMRERIFNWLHEIAALHMSLKKCIADQLMKTLKELEVSFSAETGDRAYLANNSPCIQFWIQDDFSIPGKLRRSLMEPLLFKIFAIPDFKTFFARIFVQNYCRLTELWCLLPDKTIEVYSTIFSLGVQLFTIPGLVPKMLNEENFMDLLVQSMMTTIKHKPGEIQRPLHDMQYTLEIDGVLFSVITEKNFLQQILMIAKETQFRLPVVRKLGAHIEHEGDEWVDLLNAMNSFLRMVKKSIGEEMDKILQNAPAEQREILIQSVLSVVMDMAKSMNFPETYNQPHDRPDLIAPYPISTSTISIYTPVSKIMSILLEKVMKYAPIRALEIQSPMIEYFDMCIMQMALMDQCRAQLWIRNGNNPNRLVDCVGRWIFGETLALPDISGVQMSACYLDPDEWVKRVIARYGLTHLMIPSARPDYGWPTFPCEKSQSLVGFLIKSLMYVVGTLPFMDNKQSRRKLILHWLASGGKDAQMIRSSLGSGSTISDSELMALLQEIGKMNMGSGLRQMKFDLKADQRKEFDPSFPWFIQLTDRADAFANIKRMFEMKKETYTWWPKCYQAVFPQARRVLTSMRLSGILRLVLWSCCESKFVAVSKESLSDVLYLISFAIEYCLCEEFSDEDRGKVISWICGRAPFLFWSEEDLTKISPTNPGAAQQESRLQNMMALFNRIAQNRFMGAAGTENLNNMLRLGANQATGSSTFGPKWEDVEDPEPNQEETLLQLLHRLMKKEKNAQIGLIFKKLAELCEKFDEPVLSAALFEDIGYVANNAKKAMKKAKKSKKKRKKAQRARLKAQKMIQNMSDGFKRRNQEELKELETEVGQEKKNEERFGIGAKYACVICRSYENQEDMGLMVFLQDTQCVPVMLSMTPKGSESCLSTCSHVIHKGCHTQNPNDRESMLLRKNESKCPLCGALFNAIVPFVKGITRSPKLNQACCNPTIDLAEFFNFWDNFDPGRKPDSKLNVLPEAHEEFQSRISKSIRRRDPSDALLSSLHYALKGDEALCRLLPPSQDKFYRLFSSLMSILVYHWDSFRQASDSKFFLSNIWKLDGVSGDMAENMASLDMAGDQDFLHIDACEALLKAILCYPHSFDFESADSMESEGALALIVTDFEKDGEKVEDAKFSFLADGNPIESAEVGGIYIIPPGTEKVAAVVPDSSGETALNLDFNDHYAMLQDGSDLFYRIRRPPSENSTALHHILQSCYIIHILQSLLQSGGSDEMDKLDDVNESYCILDIFQRVHGSFNKEQFENLLLPFVRYASILWHGLGLIRITPDVIWPGNAEALLSALSLPPYMSIFADQTHPRLSKLFLKFVDSEKLPDMDHNELPSLTQLPSAYSEIFQEVSNATESKDELAICLFCGDRVNIPDTEIMPSSTSHSVRQHVKQCCGYSGMFLRTRKNKATQILIVKREKSAHINSPYVDSFGCTDHGLFRGITLSLDERRYKFLTEIAISRDIPNFVMRNMRVGRGILMLDDPETDSA